MAVLASALGRGYTGRHRIAVLVADRPSTVIATHGPLHLSAGPAGDTVVPISELDPALPIAHPWRGTDEDVRRRSVAPWLTVVRTPAQPDPLADTVPHPVVTLFPLPLESTTGSLASTDHAEDEVFAQLESEREAQLTADLAAGVVPLRRDRHTA